MKSFLGIRDGYACLETGTIVGHTIIAEGVKEEIPISALKVMKVSDQLRQVIKYSLTIPARKQWVSGVVRFSLGGIVWFTDGSRLLREPATSGTRIYLEAWNVREGIGLGISTTVFQDEVYAILAVAKHQELKESLEQKIYICSHSQAALKALISPRVSNALVQECREALQELAGENDVNLVRVPGHSGVLGNEIDYQLARKGADTPFCCPEPALELSKGQLMSALSD